MSAIAGILGSGRVSRGGDGVSPSRTFRLSVTTARARRREERLFRRDAETNARDARATQNCCGDVIAHSVRKASMGFILVARSAGTKQARAATPQIKRATRL